MTKTIATLAILFSLCSLPAAFAGAPVYCPVHKYASCTDTGRISVDGKMRHLYYCQCGDYIWVG